MLIDFSGIKWFKILIYFVFYKLEDKLIDNAQNSHEAKYSDILLISNEISQTKDILICKFIKWV